MTSSAPTDNLVRALIDTQAVHLRADDGTEGDGRTLYGHFAVFNRWTEIDSYWEGRFLEQIVPGAFARTMDENRSRIKVLYDHGYDPQIGNKPLGPIRELSEDKTGAYYEVPLIETDYNDRFVIPAASNGLLGASFRFRVTEETWVEPKKASKHNPERLPERTISDVDLYEFGPVTFPAYAEATAGVRSGTDDFLDRLARDPRFLARFTERAGLAVVERLLDAAPPSARSDDPAPPPPAQGDQPDSKDDSSADGQASETEWTTASRRRFARQIEAENLGIGGIA